MLVHNERAHSVRLPSPALWRPGYRSLPPTPQTPLHRAPPKVIDMPVEDPSPNFRALRDLVDTKAVLALPEAKKTDFSKGYPESWPKLLQVPRALAMGVGCAV